MAEIIRQALAELRSAYNILHGPEFWLVLPALFWAAFISAVIGFWVFSRWGGDDE